MATYDKSSYKNYSEILVNQFLNNLNSDLLKLKLNKETLKDLFVSFKNWLKHEKVSTDYISDSEIRTIFNLELRMQILNKMFPYAPKDAELSTELTNKERFSLLGLNRSYEEMIALLGESDVLKMLDKTSKVKKEAVKTAESYDAKFERLSNSLPDELSFFVPQNYHVNDKLSDAKSFQSGFTWNWAKTLQTQLPLENNIFEHKLGLEYIPFEPQKSDKAQDEKPKKAKSIKAENASSEMK